MDNVYLISDPDHRLETAIATVNCQILIIISCNAGLSKGLNKFARKGL